MSAHRLWREPTPIPDAWRFSPLKRLIGTVDAGSSPMCESEPAAAGDWGVLKVSAVSWQSFDDRENKALPSIFAPNGADEVKVGDIIASRANTVQLCGAVQRVRSLYTRLLLCDKTWRLNPKDGVNADWLVAALKFSNSRRQIEASATGTSDSMKNVSMRDFLNVHLPVPESDEQRRIAAALAVADAAIEGAQAELAASRELKRSLMYELFEFGLNPGGPTKSCKIHRCYTATIPGHWDDERLGQSIEFVEYGTNAPSNDYRGGYPVIAIPQVVAPHLALTDVPYAEVPEAEARALRLQANDVLLIRTNGNPDYIGKSTIVSPEVAATHTIYASYLIRIRTKPDKLLGGYLNYFLASPLGRRQAGAAANTSAGNNNIGARAIRQFRLPRPPIEEQEQVVTLLDSVERQIDAQAAKVNALSDLKRSLLQNLLTGKVRIPEGVIDA
jgi:restriction endonuclease S subunit